MAQLKDLIVNGASRLIGDAFVNKIQITSISAPTSSGGTTYGLGTSGQVLKSNGTSVYWGTDSNSVTGVKGNSESSYRTGNVNITAANIGLGNVENTKLSTWAGSSNITTIGTLSSGTVPWARLSNVPAGATKEGTVTKVIAGTGLNTSADLADSATKGSITTTGTLYLTKSGVTAGSYGPSTAVTGNEGTTMNVPYITVDAYGRVTSISNKVYTAKNTTYTFTAGTSTLAWNSEVTLATVGGLAIKAKLPANPNTNTDTLVKQTAKTDSVEYKILSTTSASPTSGNAAEAAYGADFTINPSAKTITSPNYKVTANATITYNTTNGCLEIIV